MTKKMKISILGMGYVGSVSAACLARDGHDVIGVDPAQEKLALFRAGRAPIVEEGIQELTRTAVQSGRLSVTDDVKSAVLSTDISFVCVGTPSSRNGSQDLAAVKRAIESIGQALAEKSSFHTVVLRSTVAPGTSDLVVRPILEQSSGKRYGVDFGLCFQPEFLREGSSIRDYDTPPFTIVGGGPERSLSALRSLFDHLPCDFIAADIRTAESVKMMCNAFHALKITFANEVGRICESLEIDGRSVMDLLCRDTRLNISPAYLKPGFAFGGSCLPKDLRALMFLGREREVETPMLANVLPSNQVHIERAVERILKEGRPRVAMLGLSFKPGTDDLRESPLVTMAEKLLGKGVPLAIFDADVTLSRLIGANKKFIEDVIPHLGELLVDTPEKAMQEADVIIVGQSVRSTWQAVYSAADPHQLVIDLVGGADRQAVKARYWGIGWP